MLYAQTSVAHSGTDVQRLQEINQHLFSLKDKTLACAYYRETTQEHDDLVRRLAQGAPQVVDAQLKLWHDLEKTLCGSEAEAAAVLAAQAEDAVRALEDWEIPTDTPTGRALAYWRQATLLLLRADFDGACHYWEKNRGDFRRSAVEGNLDFARLIAGVSGEEALTGGPQLQGELQFTSLDNGYREMCRALIGTTDETASAEAAEDPAERKKCARSCLGKTAVEWVNCVRGACARVAR
jgi:hypothetical protein